MTALDLDQFAADHGLKTREDLLLALRYRYGTAAPIITLTSTELRSKDPETVAFFEEEMSWFFDDLGNCFMDCWDGVRHAIENGEALATKPTTGDMHGRFAGLPCIVLGAGPGASVHWDAIKASRGRAILIVCDVMLKPCLERGIVPDFVSAIERTPDVYEALADTPTAGTTLLAPAVVERRLIDHFSGQVIWCWRGCGLETWIDSEIPRNNFGRSCGVQGIGVALLAGCSPIYLVGHDLCMDGDRTHAEGAQESVMGTAEKLDRNEYHMRKTVKSISGRDVQTIHLWGMFKSDIEHLIREHQGCIVINTGDGLPITGTFPGEISPAWGNEIVIPTISRTNPGKDRRSLIPLMLADIPNIEARCREVMASDVADGLKLQLSTMTHEETKQVWTELYHGTYSGAMIRLHLQPSQHLIMLKRVANTIVHTLPIIREGLNAIKAP